MKITGICIGDDGEPSISSNASEMGGTFHEIMASHRFQVNLVRSLLNVGYVGSPKNETRILTQFPVCIETPKVGHGRGRAGRRMCTSQHKNTERRLSWVRACVNCGSQGIGWVSSIGLLWLFRVIPFVDASYLCVEHSSLWVLFPSHGWMGCFFYLVRNIINVKKKRKWKRKRKRKRKRKEKKQRSLITAEGFSSLWVLFLCLSGS